MMRKKLTYLIIATTLVFAGFLSSCNKVADLLEITLEDFEYFVEVPMEIASDKSNSYTFGGTGAFDPNASPEDESFGKIIKQVNLKSIIIMVSTLSASSPVEISDAIFTVTDGITGRSLTYQITEPTTLYLAKTFEIDPSTPNFDVLSDILKNLHPATININGHINQNEIALSFMYAITADLTLGI